MSIFAVRSILWMIWSFSAYNNSVELLRWIVESQALNLRNPRQREITIAQSVEQLLLNVFWRATDHLLPDTVQSFLSIFFRTEEVWNNIKSSAEEEKHA